MESVQWLAYFEANAHRPSPDTPARLTPLAPSLQAPLIRALQCFQLGEAGEGRVAREASLSNDPALDDNLKEAVGFYVREEGRHARELARLLRAMGAPTIKKHEFERWFEQSRRMFGLRGKMAVTAVAEVVGSTFYNTLATRTPCPEVAEVTRVIGADEDRHLEFQRDYFTRILEVTPAGVRSLLAVILWTWFLGVLAAAIASVSLGHRKLFIALGIGPGIFAADCVKRLKRLIDETAAQREGAVLTAATR